MNQTSWARWSVDDKGSIEERLDPDDNITDADWTPDSAVKRYVARRWGDDNDDAGAATQEFHEFGNAVAWIRGKP